MLVGRILSAEILLAEKGVSRRHAKITVDGDSVTIEDVGSSNGTFVNGERVVGTQQVQEGDKIQIGDATAVLLQMDHPSREIVHHGEVERVDPITGLLDRSAFLPVLRQAFSETKEAEEPLTLALVRVDGLLEFGDVFGDDQVALLLRKIAQQIHGVVDTEDSIATRFGDEEFALLFRRATISNAQNVTEWISTNIPLTFKCPNGEAWDGPVYISFGVVDTLTTPATTPAAFLDAAVLDLLRATLKVRAKGTSHPTSSR
jgi:diguanylate cyclase (GGDEF)-like protein